MKILGLSFFYHDAAAALLEDGIPIALAEEERFSRKKHDFNYPENAINFVLEAGKIKPQDLDYVVFYEKPFIKFERIIKTLLATWPSSAFAFTDSFKSWMVDKLWIRELIARKLKINPKKILFCEHHLSHAASTFFCSPFEKSAILTIDGIGEWATTTIGIGEGNKLKILKEIHFPHSVGLLYSTFTAFLGFEINEGEYKVMGMAPYGKPIFLDKVKKLVKLYDDGSFELNLDYFDFHRSNSRSYSKEFLKLFGKPRAPDSKFFTRESGWLTYFGKKPDNWEELAKEQEYYAHIAASIQKLTEEIIINLAQAAYKETGIDKLSYAGGVALNSVANYKILKETPFKEIFIQPAASDAGGALGAALYLYYALLNNQRKFVLEHAFYGKSYSESEIEDFLKKKNIKYKKFSDEEALLDYTVDKLLKQKVIGWFQGRFEWGPRALGNRSILADPRNEKMKDIVNIKIKFREPYRPFAPSVLVEKADKFFELPEPEKQYPARFMLYVVNVKEEKRHIVPAITHVDGTARPQTVFKETNQRYWKLIKKFEESCGIPLLLNTSFNLKGEPIVNSPSDAFNTFIKSGLDVLVLENVCIEK
ncbi:MAG: carbamoyltransferase [Candidatus Pacearchaeota archaeon]